MPGNGASSPVESMQQNTQKLLDRVLAVFKEKSVDLSRPSVYGRGVISSLRERTDALENQSSRHSSLRIESPSWETKEQIANEVSNALS